MTSIEPQRARSAAEVSDPWARWGWLMAVVWLFFLYYPGLALTESRAAFAWVIVGWFALVCFAAAYVIGFVLGMRAGWTQKPPVVIWLFAAAIGCVLVTIPAIGWNAASFLPFLMAYAAYGFGGVWHWIVSLSAIVIVCVRVGVALQSGETPPWILLGIVIIMAVINAINVWLIGRSVLADELRVDLATSEQRETIARDVHDLLGHSLTVVKLKAELASRLVETDPARAKSELHEIVRITAEAIDGVRGTVTDLRSNPNGRAEQDSDGAPSASSAGRLAAQLEASREVLESTGHAVEVHGSANALSPAQAIPAAWILREATTNILRHAKANRVRISVAPGTLRIDDDGTWLPRDHDGNGITGMRERATSAGATFEIGTDIDGADALAGTSVMVTW